MLPNRSVNKHVVIHHLIEYEPTWVPSADLSMSDGHALWQQFDQQKHILQVGFPSPKTEHNWSIISNGWVGFIQASPSLQFQLAPRFAIKNLFVLWAYAYGFDQTKFAKALVSLETIPQFQAYLATWLASETISCAKSGFAKAYVQKEEKLPYIRGRLKAFSPAETAVLCQYDQLTTNIPDNQILAYTLRLLCQSPTLDESTKRQVRQATHLINQVAEPRPFTADACYGRSYNRLNQKYRLLHQLCGFFIEQISPTHQIGAHPFPAFLIHTPRLFERFVAQWLKQNLPPAWQIETQERVVLGNQSQLVFQIDIVLYNKFEQKPLAVLDTKYKRGSKIASSDIHQLIAYAKLKSCQQAILIFPAEEEVNLDVFVDDIHLQALSFNLNNEIDDAGNKLLIKLQTLLETNKESL